MIAVLKAGAAFVPIDVAYPSARRQEIIGQVGAAIVLVSPHSAQLCEGMAKTIVEVSSLLDSQLPHALPSTSSDIVLHPIPENVAYVLFTSGSTGKPKGVVIEHAAFCTSALAHGKALGLLPSSRVLQFSTHAFDASLVEILTTLILGGCICVPSEEARMNNLAQAIQELNVNWAVLTPSVSRLIQPQD